MFCSNCGNKLNVGETFCANCGTKIVNEVAQNTNLTISRDNVLGFAVDIDLDLNGQKFSLSSGQVLNLMLLPGTHILKYKVWCRREKSVTIKVVEGKQYSVKFAYDALWGGFKVDKLSVLE